MSREKKTMASNHNNRIKKNNNMRESKIFIFLPLLQINKKKKNNRNDF